MGTEGTVGCGLRAGSKNDGGLLEPMLGDTKLCGGLAIAEIGDAAVSSSRGGLSDVCVCPAAAAAASCRRRR